MLSALKTANFFIYLMPEDENELTNLKINKLLFYAQGHFLKHFSKPLFGDEIQVWQYGPVVLTVYHHFKGYGKNVLNSLPKDFSLSDYSDDEKELLVDVAREYGQYTGEALKTKTHEESTPWSNVYDPNVRNITIGIDSIEEYFSLQPDIKLKDFNIPDDAIIGYHDEDGILTLPGAYDY